jgi:hypothetical protein
LFPFFRQEKVHPPHFPVIQFFGGPVPWSEWLEKIEKIWTRKKNQKKNFSIFQKSIFSKFLRPPFDPIFRPFKNSNSPPSSPNQKIRTQMSPQFSDLFFQGPIHIIASLISVADQLSLSYTCKMLNMLLSPISTNSIKTLIVDRLVADFGFTRDKAYEFLNVVHSSGSYISGSLILQIVLGEVWEGSDLDIYSCESKLLFDHPDCDENTNDPNEFILQRWLYNNGFENKQHLANVYTHAQPVQFENPHYSKYGRSMPQENGYSFCKFSARCFVPSSNHHAPEIQNMFRLDMHRLEFIKTYFDLDMCKLAYNGKDLFIFHPDSVVTRKSLYGRRNIQTFQLIRDGQGGKLVELATKRIEKYLSRGFDIQLSDEWATLVNLLISGDN